MKDKEIEVIVKPIFTKMFNSNFSACEYGIECYKKGMEYQGIKELAIENDNLIKRVKELEKENEYQKQARSIAENAVVDLCKENAELKHNKKTIVHLADCLEGKIKERIEELEADNRLLEQRGSDILKELLDKNKRCMKLERQIEKLKAD